MKLVPLFALSLYSILFPRPFFFFFNFILLSTSLWLLVMPGNFCDRELLGHGITFCPAESRRTNVPFSPVNAAELKRAAGSPLDHILSGFIDPASAGESQTANSFRVARPMPITAILPIKVVSVDNRDVFPRFLPILLRRLDPGQPGRSSWKNITFSTKRVITRSNEKWMFLVTMFHLAFPVFFSFFFIKAIFMERKFKALGNILFTLFPRTRFSLSGMNLTPVH